MAEVTDWITVNDFSPGIVNRSEYALGGVGLPAPLGSAQETNTFRCIALPSGGLAPLPKRGTTLALPAPEASMANVIDGYFATGFASMGAVDGTSDNLFLAVEYIFNNAGNPQRRFRLYRIRDISGVSYSVDTVKSINSAQLAPAHSYNWVPMFPTRVHPTTPTSPGIPVLAMAWQAFGGGAEQFISIWPDPAAPNVNAPFDYSTLRFGHILGHQARIVLLEFVNYVFGNAGKLVITNEQVSFTDPPNSVTLPTQAEVFVQETPTGFGAWGSVSAGELFFVKRQGGGVVVSGDIANPTITYLPGVTPVGAYTEKAISTKSGMLYVAKDQGAHIWNGGNSSSKVSNQLENSTFDNPDAGGGDMQAFTSFCNWGGDWVLLTNNWLWDQTTGNWWKIEDPSAFRVQHWEHGYVGPTVYGLLAKYTNPTANALSLWDRTVPSSSYNWRSHPIPKSINRVLDTREITVLIEGSGTVTITLIDLAGNSASVVFTASNVSQPQLLRDVISSKGYSIIVDINSVATATGPAPIVHMVNLGIYEAQQAIRVG